MMERWERKVMMSWEGTGDDGERRKRREVMRGGEEVLVRAVMHEVLML